MTIPKKGEIVEFEIEDLAFGARGVAKIEDFVWFIDRTLPGQRVRARIGRKRRSYGEARLIEVLREAPGQISPPCPYFGTCGGCQTQHWEYNNQLAAKTQQVSDILSRLGGHPDVTVHPTLASEHLFHYRNKMEFTFSDRRWTLAPPAKVVSGADLERLSNEDPAGEEAAPISIETFPTREDRLKKAESGNVATNSDTDFALGMHVPGRFDKVLHLDACLLQSERSNRLLQLIAKESQQSGLPPYGQKSHTGFWRFCIIREGQNTGDWMLNLITSGQAGEAGDLYMDHLCETVLSFFPELTTFIHGKTDSKGQVAHCESLRVLHGPGKITDKIGDKEFEISPDAFFQTNTRQAERLFDTIASVADFKGDEILYDLYCGTGAIGIVLADRVKSVLGVEVIEAAVVNARRNVSLNKLSNIDIVLADMKDALVENETIRNFENPDVVIIDPPRGGTHPKTIRDILVLGAPKLIYVSCNPPMLAKDSQELRQIYDLECIKPVDMFPHTKHIEAVALFTRKEA